LSTTGSSGGQARDVVFGEERLQVEDYHERAG
jgi:hypothetical protein